MVDSPSQEAFKQKPAKAKNITICYDTPCDAIEFDTHAIVVNSAKFRAIGQMICKIPFNTLDCMKCEKLGRLLTTIDVIVQSRVE